MFRESDQAAINYKMSTLPTISIVRIQKNVPGQNVLPGRQMSQKSEFFFGLCPRADPKLNPCGYEISTCQMQYDAGDKKMDQEDPCFIYARGN